MRPSPRLKRLLTHARAHVAENLLGYSYPDWIINLMGNPARGVPRLSWETAEPLALAIDPYSLAEQLGVTKESIYRRNDLAKQFEAWSGSVVDLWLTLSLAQRYWRDQQYMSRSDEVLLNNLARSLAHAIAVELGEDAAPAT